MFYSAVSSASFFFLPPQPAPQKLAGKDHSEEPVIVGVGVATPEKLRWGVSHKQFTK